MNDFYEQFSSDGWGILMVDASNAFKSLNRMALLWNTCELWLRCLRFIINTYRGWSPLLMKGLSQLLYSEEGVTQGDPLSMILYAVGTLPLVHYVGDPGQRAQIWYANDSSACSAMSDLKVRFQRLLVEGPKYGYFPEVSWGFCWP